MIEIAHVTTTWKPGTSLLRTYFNRVFVDEEPTIDRMQQEKRGFLPVSLEERVAVMLEERRRFGLHRGNYLETIQAHAQRLIMRGYEDQPKYEEKKHYTDWNAPNIPPLGAFA